MIAEMLADLVLLHVEEVAEKTWEKSPSKEVFDATMEVYLQNQKNLLLLTTSGITTGLGLDVNTAIATADNALTHNWMQMALALAWQGIKVVGKAAFNLGKKLATKSNKPVNVEKLADKVAKNLGGVKTYAKGDGYRVRIPNGKKDIVVRIMEKGGERGNPYYRIGVDSKSNVTRLGKFSDDPALTHLDIRTRLKELLQNKSNSR